MRYFIHFSYDGTNYHGWQIQPNGITVQGELQHALSVLLRTDTPVTGAGRTDTGVHARNMVAHFDTEATIDGEQLVYKLNRLLPRDIAVSRIVEVADDMHARFSATRRTYRYYVCTKKDPFSRNYYWHTHFNLDFELMNTAADVLKEYDDFGAFCKSHSDVKTTLCTIYEAQWHRQADGSWYFEITANRFLRNMVRAVVGTLVEVGRHRMSIEEFRRVIEGKKRTDAGESMPGHALFLESVEY
ncbi:MAG: tRNA pseudouridine(38-40) synthase TruA [Prevotella sp.]|nr:tRNA pseudouridine(38-40) synthase TruA [Prevotella sp.]